MKIETKYNINQDLFLLIRSTGKCKECSARVDGKWIVKPACIDGFVMHGSSSWYTLRYGSGRVTATESDLFATREEAEAECERRNGK
jgi:hypothetical protein